MLKSEMTMSSSCQIRYGIPTTWGGGGGGEGGGRGRRGGGGRRRGGGGGGGGRRGGAMSHAREAARAERIQGPHDQRDASGGARASVRGARRV